MQFLKSTFVLALATLAMADCDGDSCSSSGRVAVGTSTSNGIAYTEYSTTTGITRSTTLIPLYRTSVYTSTITGVDGSATTFTRTTDFAVGPTDTIVLSGTTSTSVGLVGASGYTLVTSGGSTYPTPIPAVSTSMPSAMAASSSSMSRSSGMAVQTAAPLFGAAAIAAGGLALLI